MKEKPLKHEPVLAKLNELRKDAQGEGGVEEKALYHMFCFISYEVWARSRISWRRTKRRARKKIPLPAPKPKNISRCSPNLEKKSRTTRTIWSSSRSTAPWLFISQIDGDFQAYLNEAGEG